MKYTNDAALHRPALRALHTHESNHMARTNEIALNTQLGNVLRGKHPLWRHHISVEETGVIQGHPGLQPDILVRAPNAQPVAVETEYAPAATVEADAMARLGLIPVDTTEPIEQVVAVRLPVSLRSGQADLAHRIALANFDYCVLSGSPSSPARWPTTGWLTGGINDIVRCIEHAMVSQRLVDESMEVLEAAVRAATRVIEDAAETGLTDIEVNLGRTLNQHAGEQTNRMAMTIIANALTFHSTIAGAHDIPSVAQLRNDPSSTLQLSMLDTWQRILAEINYWPIFKVASDLLAPIGAPTANRILEILVAAADRLADLGVTSRHDLSGRMFQNLIADRKFPCHILHALDERSPSGRDRRNAYECRLEQSGSLSGSSDCRPLLWHRHFAVRSVSRCPDAISPRRR